MPVMCKGHFLTLVAKNHVVLTFGDGVKNWPDQNFWMMVNSVKSSIRDDQIPNLLTKYSSIELNDYPGGSDEKHV